MAEIAALPWNGCRVASTFAGCGGSSLGYRMAGFRIVWANEFIPIARECYRANASDQTIIDDRDIRSIDPASILAATGLLAGELDVLDGSPPCASFSTAGKRQRDWGKVKQYSAGRAQRTDDLFFEFVRILRGLQPKVFVAENVSGLVKGVGKGYFLEILAALKASDYHVTAKLLDAQWLGVPQARQRLFFIGTRRDLAIDPAFPTPRSYRYSVRDVLPWIDAVECANGFNGHAMATTGQPAATVQASRSLKVRINTKRGPRSASDPAPTVQTHGNRHTRSEMTLAVEPAPVVIRQGNGSGYSAQRGQPIDLAKPVPTIVARGNRYSGGTDQFVVETESDMSRFAVGRELAKLGQGEQSDRYFQLVRASVGKPVPTITAGGGDASKASVAHPIECRKFSIAELRRICAFPDDFVLHGSYAEQWERLGRAVPPLMMAAIAETIRDQVLDPVRRKGADRSAPLAGRIAA